MNDRMHPYVTGQPPERWSSGRREFNEGWAEAVEKVNLDRERGDGPFALPRPGWDAQQRVCWPAGMQARLVLYDAHGDALWGSEALPVEGGDSVTFTVPEGIELG